MTRFKERKRIDDALGSADLTELRWALAYCEMRLQIAARADHLKHWRDLKVQVRSKLDLLEDSEDAKRGPRG
jgi:hypothetical protein